MLGLYNLISGDLFKIRKSTAMKILFGITSISAVAVTVVAFLIAHGKIDRSTASAWFLFSDVNVIGILGGVIAAIYICGDFENKIIHDAVASGCSRASVVVSKAIVLCCTAAFILLPYAIATCIAVSTGAKFSMGSISVGFLNLITAEAGKAFSASQILKLIIIMLALIIVYLAQISICVPLSLGLKKPVLVVAINYGFTIFCAQLGTLRKSSEAFDHISALTPYGGDYSLMTLGTANGDIIKAIAVSLIFIFIMLVISYFGFRKSEIK